MARFYLEQFCLRAPDCDARQLHAVRFALQKNSGIARRIPSRTAARAKVLSSSAIVSTPPGSGRESLRASSRLAQDLYNFRGIVLASLKERLLFDRFETLHENRCPGRLTAVETALHAVAASARDGNPEAFIAQRT